MRWKDNTLAGGSGKAPLYSVATVVLLTPPIPFAAGTAWKEEKEKEADGRAGGIRGQSRRFWRDR